MAHHPQCNDITRCHPDCPEPRAASITRNVIALKMSGGLAPLKRGEKGWISFPAFHDSFGTPHYRWIITHWDGMGGREQEVWFVPTFAIELKND